LNREQEYPKILLNITLYPHLLHVTGVWAHRSIDPFQNSVRDFDLLSEPGSPHRQIFVEFCGEYFYPFFGAWVTAILGQMGKPVRRFPPMQPPDWLILLVLWLSDYKGAPWRDRRFDLKNISYFQAFCSKISAKSGQSRRSKHDGV
jgi:hypothetical protein